MILESMTLGTATVLPAPRSLEIRPEVQTSLPFDMYTKKLFAQAMSSDKRLSTTIQDRESASLGERESRTPLATARMMRFENIKVIPKSAVYKCAVMKKPKIA